MGVKDGLAGERAVVLEHVVGLDPERPRDPLDEHEELGERGVVHLVEARRVALRKEHAVAARERLELVSESRSERSAPCPSFPSRRGP